MKKGGSAKNSNARRASRKAPLTITRPDLLVDGSDATFRRLVHNLFAFGARHVAIRDGHAAQIGLTGIEYTFLIAIRHLEDDDDVSVRQLADHLHLSGPFATTMVGKLITRGLIEKEPSESDRRKVKLSVTEKGHELLSSLAPTQRQVNDVQFGVLSKGEFQMLSALLEKLIDSGDKALALQSYLSAAHPPAA